MLLLTLSGGGDPPGRGQMGGGAELQGVSQTRHLPRLTPATPCLSWPL